MEIKYGLTGNYYAYSKDRKDLIDLCGIINKSESSIYYNNKYKVYSIRVKNKGQKILLKNYIK